MNDKFLATVQINEESRFEIQLAWFETHPPLGDNKTVARKRLRNLVKKLQPDEHYSAYNNVLMEWLKDGIID